MPYSQRSLVIFVAMTRRVLTITALCAFSAFSKGQSLEVFPAQIDFNYVDELAPDSIEVTFYNKTPTAFAVTREESRVVYNDDAFRMSPSQIVVPALDSAKVWIVFEPTHNVEYDSDLILANDGPGGAAVLNATAHGRYSNSYYSSTEGLSEEALKTAMNTLLAQNFNSLSYNAARDQMYGSLDNVNGQVECVYTGRTATFNDRTGANNNSFNCEHTFPQGFFSQLQPMRADIHHLFPTDANTNSRRSNHPFGVVSNPTWTGGGSKYGNSVFEPRDAHKGAAARAMLYFVIRYQDYTNFFAPQESILKTWHQNFPPSAFEEGRNQGIYQLQNNRNPFVDYPQFADRINNFVSNSTADPVFELSLAHDTIHLPQDPNETHAVIFRTAVLNTGNQPIYVGPQAITAAPISFANGTGAPETLMPGEAKVIDLEYPYDLDLTQIPAVNLELLTNMPNGTVSIPLSSEAFDLSSTEETGPSMIRAYPNPTENEIHLNERAVDVKVFALNGTLLLETDNTSVELEPFNHPVVLVHYSVDGVTHCDRVLIH